MRKTEIKPCPFCGGEAELTHGTLFDGEARWFDVICKNTRCRGFSLVCNNHTEDEAIEAWNKRADDE